MNLYLESLGCDKNRVDSEKLLSELLEKYEGAKVTMDPAEADIAIVNTCSFIGPAKEESINTILELAEYKKTGKLQKLIVAGCLVERYKDEIRKELPEIDEIASVKDYVSRLDKQMKRVESGERYTRYLKIAEGCDKYCSYCIIPRLRGHYRSIPMEQILEEAGQLVLEGAKELILVAQETTLYGTDLYGEKSLHKLLHALGEIEGLEWIRVLYCYPEEIELPLIEEIRDNPKVCHYLDLPIQHSSDRILKVMNRKTRRAELKEKIALLRREIPDICLRTTLITGFPGETEEDLEDVLSFIREERFDRLGVFPYSQEEGTYAATMDNQVPESVKNKRLSRIMELQQEIAFQKAEEQKGRVLKALVVGFDEEESRLVLRSYMDNPDIDSFIYLKGEERAVGDFVCVRIIDTEGYDLIGEYCESSQ
ncbi:ribosomal protein S12 methylthiotransferase RimO [Oribacterium parvum ACB1]|uniref:Ribosomal protein uS12 methylthiotransferase RimO n=1 Tax=Oribacterium parvum ACB1 TaxID=796943 RepID=G9WMS0_9FIRM|nr:30S ribosomal protein S12 methylthiotransferase RimO [Oribacterium parvum]EHL11823.1 ribosomal protein S12 methylthiotransferase RimO [Oribacterium parvum ACB1]EJF13500.1 ribosomal protein S12 methylthiotransferase RimO [Oribacterium parvum ACB8]